MVSYLERMDLPVRLAYLHHRYFHPLLVHQRDSPERLAYLHHRYFRPLLVHQRDSLVQLAYFHPLRVHQRGLGL